MTCPHFSKLFGQSLLWRMSCERFELLYDHEYAGPCVTENYICFGPSARLLPRFSFAAMKELS